MKSEKLGAVLGAAIIFVLAAFFSGGNVGAADVPPANDPLARVVDAAGGSYCRQLSDSAVATGAELSTGDTLVVEENAYAVLLFDDGELVRYDGPTVVVMSETDTGQGSVLARLSSMLCGLLCRQATTTGDASLVMRTSSQYREVPLRVPRLLVPPDGCRLRELPAQLVWQDVDGIYQYRVAIFDSTGLIWQTHTPTSQVRLGDGAVALQVGTVYLWVVECEIGDSRLRSKQASFEIIDPAEVELVNQALSELAATVGDERLRAMMAVQVLAQHGLTLDCLQELEDALRRFPDDRGLTLMKADLMESLAFHEVAAALYRTLIE